MNEMPGASYPRRLDAADIDAVKGNEAGSILTSENDLYFNIALGAEPFLGVVGVECQWTHHAVGIGYPNRLLYRYFVIPYQDSAFWGYFWGMSYDNVDETVDGIEYQDLDTEYIGVGAVHPPKSAG